jgi:hypothetical protein
MHASSDLESESIRHLMKTMLPHDVRVDESVAPSTPSSYANHRPPRAQHQDIPDSTIKLVRVRKDL